MKNKTIFAVSFPFLICILLASFCFFPVCVYGATAEQDSVKLELVTNSTQYETGDTILGYAIVTNTSATSMDNVNMVLRVDLPGDLSLEVDDTSASGDSLDSGDALYISFQGTAAEDYGYLPNTGEDFPLAALLIILSIVVLASTLVIYAIKERRANSITSISLLLVLVLTSSALVTADSAFAETERKTLSVTETIQVNSVSYELEATVAYDFHGVMPGDASGLRSSFDLEIPLLKETHTASGVVKMMPLEGGVFELKSFNTPGDPRLMTTAADGMVRFEDLTPGTYSLSQISVPTSGAASHSPTSGTYSSHTKLFFVVIGSDGNITVEDTKTNAKPVLMENFQIIYRAE